MWFAPAGHTPPQASTLGVGGSAGLAHTMFAIRLARRQRKAAEHSTGTQLRSLGRATWKQGARTVKTARTQAAHLQ